MAVVVLSPSNVANFAAGGGHFWVYMQYVDGLRALGCDVYWLESFRRSGDAARDGEVARSFFERMRRFDMDGRVILYVAAPQSSQPPVEYLGASAAQVTSLISRADLLLNFFYGISPTLLERFRRTALVDIDPGLLQFWINAGQLSVPQHDLYFTTGETVGADDSRIPTCGLTWLRIRPPVALERWPVSRATGGVFTTVSNWWGGDGTGSGEWIVSGDGSYYDNSKRRSFLNHLTLPQMTPQPVELALCFGPEEAEERPLLERYGWRVRHTREVAASPECYQTYVQQSRGEFSCAKRSCVEFQNAWISDRSLCYLASGKPIVVEHTGPSELLPDGLGVFRFSTTEQASEAFARINEDYTRHSDAARALVEAHFGARRVVSTLLDRALQ